MKSKKIFSLLLSTIITFSLASTTYGQDISTKNIGLVSSSTLSNQDNSKISKEDAKTIAKKALNDYFGISIDDTVYQTNVNFTPSYTNGSSSKDYVWMISWNSNDQQKNVNINVTVDANSGKLLSVNSDTYTNNQTPAVATLTQDQAEKIGEDFLSKINPKEFAQSKLVDNTQFNNSMRGIGSSYDFSYSRIANGIPFLSDSLNVGVDGVTGKICSYSINWSDNTIPELSNDIISQDKANQTLEDNLKLQPNYILYRDQYGIGDTNQTLKLVYSLKPTNGTTLDAKTGTMINDIPASAEVKDLDAADKKSFIASYKPVNKLPTELDSDSAETIMNQITSTIYGDSYDIRSSNYQQINNEFGSSQSSWTGEFYKKGSTNQLTDGGSITIDSLTGQLISINKFTNGMTDSNNDTTTPKITWDQAYATAIATVEKYFPDKVKDISTEQSNIQNTLYANKLLQLDRDYNFNFNRIINGIPYKDNSININFDAKTGEISNIYTSWEQNLQVPSNNGIMSQEDAEKIFFAKYTPELVYSLTNTSTDPTNPVMVVKPVYILSNGQESLPYNNVDAFTGKLLDYNGQEIDNNIDAFKAKIKGNPLEKELSILAYQGIIDTKDFDINKQITRLDLLKMLVNLKGYTPYITNDAPSLNINYNGTKGDETYKYLQAAVSYGIIDNSGSFNGDEKITREEMIKDIVNLAGYGKLAESKDIFAVTYSDVNDITPGNLGYVAISKGLGLTNDTDNKFRPKDNATITDAAFAIYKILDSFRNIQS